MKKVTIINNISGKVTHGNAQIEDPAEWIAECVDNNSWGLPGEYEVVIEDITEEYEAGEQEKIDDKAEKVQLKNIIKTFKEGNATNKQAQRAIAYLLKRI